MSSSVDHDNSLYSDLPFQSLPDNLRTLLPRDKFDVRKAESLAIADGSTVEKILPYLICWLKDGNWPVAQALSPLLASMGAALIPEIQKVLSGPDELWKYWVLNLLVARMEPRHVAALKPQIEELSRKNSTEDVDLVARGILDGMIG